MWNKPHDLIDANAQAIAYVLIHSADQPHGD